MKSSKHNSSKPNLLKPWCHDAKNANEQYNLAWNHKFSKPYNFKPNWFSYLPERIYAVDEKYLPVIIDPIIAKWIKCESSNINFEDIKNNKSKTKYYLKLCVMYYVNNLERQFEPQELIKKLDIFGSKINYKDIFTKDEGEQIITKCIQTNKLLMACELVHRGVEVSFEFCMKIGDYGVLLYSIYDALEREINIDKSFIDDSKIILIDDNDKKDDKEDIKEETNRYYTFNELYGDVPKSKNIKIVPDLKKDKNDKNKEDKEESIWKYEKTLICTPRKPMKKLFVEYNDEKIVENTYETFDKKLEEFFNMNYILPGKVIEKHITNQPLLIERTNIKTMIEKIQENKINNGINEEKQKKKQEILKMTQEREEEVRQTDNSCNYSALNEMSQKLETMTGEIETMLSEGTCNEDLLNNSLNLQEYLERRLEELKNDTSDQSIPQVQNNTFHMKQTPLNLEEFLDHIKCDEKEQNNHTLFCDTPVSQIVNRIQTINGKEVNDSELKEFIENNTQIQHTENDEMNDFTLLHRKISDDENEL